MNIEWFKERWLEFRWGHTSYIAYALALSNFVLIFYRLLVEYIEPMAKLFPSLLVFAVATLIIYPPVAIIIGHLHRKKQLHTELRVQADENPIYQKLLEVEREIREIKEKLKC